MTDVNYSGKIEWPEFAVALAEKLKPDEDDEVSFIIKSIFIKEKILSISELLKKISKPNTKNNIIFFYSYITLPHRLQSI